MSYERETGQRRRWWMFLLVLALIASMSLSPAAGVAASESGTGTVNVSGYAAESTGDGGVTVSARTSVKPGNISFLYAKTFKARKGLSQKKYNKKFRLVVLYWTKAENADKYQIWYSYKKNGTYKKAVKKTVAGTSSGNYLFYKLAYKNNKTVYFKVTPYKGSTAGSTSRWVSIKAGNVKKNAKSVKITGGNATLYIGDTKSYKASVTPAKSLEKTVRWISSNSSVAKVDSKGKVTATGKGSATIYAIAHDGKKASVQVTVNKVNAPEISVSWGIKSSKISWTAASGVDGYELYSRVTKTGTDKLLASVGSGTRAYTDTYYDTSTKSITTSLSDAGSYLKYTYYLDSTVNPLVYSVRAYKTVNGKKKYSAYSEDFHLERPTIAAATEPSGGKVTLTWGKSTMADGYYIYNGQKGSDGKGTNWKKIATASASSSVRISKSVSYDSSRPYYTVRAYAQKNGVTCLSGAEETTNRYDETFHVDGKQTYTGTSILYIGDSITYGTPYTGVTSSGNPYYNGSSDVPYGFSYPRRVYQLTGVKFTNVSVPGATYTYIDSKDYPNDTGNYTNCSGRRCLTITKDQMKADTAETDSYKSFANDYNYDEAIESLNKGSGGVFKGTVDLGSGFNNTGKFSDYDIIILAVGTNDAKRCQALGKSIGDLSVSNTDNTNFTGAVNRILSYIEDANASRIEAGKDPVKIVFVDLFYRADISNGAATVNTYQNRLSAIAAMWNAKWGQPSPAETGADSTDDTNPRIYRFQHNYLSADNAETLSSDYLHLTRFSQGQIGSQLAEFMINNNVLTK